MKLAGWILGFWFAASAVSCSTRSAPAEVAPSVMPSAVTATGVPSPPTALAPSTAEDEYAVAREAMVQKGIIGWGITDEAVIRAMRTVPRHEFVPSDYLSQAYENHPLPIGYGQTISQPTIVAVMTEAVKTDADDRVLEIGTGSGYQAAVLSEVADQVYTVEIIGALAESARERLARLGYDDVSVGHADGYFGWEKEAPFDAIVVTAVPDHIPPPLVHQLRIGGRMVIPVGPVGGYQTLWLVTRVSETEVRTEDLGGVSFLPLTRGEQ